MYEYETEYAKSKKPVLIDFFAEECPPCRAIAPVMEEISKEYDDQLDVVKVDVNNQPALAFHFSILTVPTVVLMKDGETVYKSVGAKPTAHYRPIIDNIL